LKKELVEHLRLTRVVHRSRHHIMKTDHHGGITDTVSISERPASVADWTVPGHWEGDLRFVSTTREVEGTAVGRDAPVGRDSRVVDRPGQTDPFSPPMTLQRVDAEY
jgi:IS30 family transposase